MQMQYRELEPGDILYNSKTKEEVVVESIELKQDKDGRPDPNADWIEATNRVYGCAAQLYEENWYPRRGKRD